MAASVNFLMNPLLKPFEVPKRLELPKPLNPFELPKLLNPENSLKP